MYLRPPAYHDNAKTSNWIRMRQCGIRYELAEGDQRIVDKHFIIKPRAEFEVCDESYFNNVLLFCILVVRYWSGINSSQFFFVC